MNLFTQLGRSSANRLGKQPKLSGLRHQHNPHSLPRKADQIPLPLFWPIQPEDVEGDTENPSARSR